MPPTKRAPAPRDHAHPLGRAHDLERTRSTNDLTCFHRHPHDFPTGWHYAFRYAVPSASSSRLALPDLVASPYPVAALAHHRPRAGPVLGPPTLRLEVQSMSRICTTESHRSIVWPVVSR